MAIFTQAELDQIKQAILDLAAGKRVVSISTPDGRNVTYNQADIGKLRKLLSDASADVGAATKGARVVGIRTSKVG